MRNKLRLVAISMLMVPASAAAFLAACSSDDTVVTKDGGPDGTTPETSLPDGSPDLDGGPDGPTPDSGYTVSTWRAGLGAVLCESLARCCFGNGNLPEDAGVDASTGPGNFTKQKCIDFYASFGFEQSSLGVDASAPANVDLDQAKAIDCLAKAKALACSVSGTDFQALRTACFGALKGKLAGGATCVDNMECAVGQCKSTKSDGTPSANGTCGALAGDGGPCNNNVGGGDYAESSCSTRGGGDTKQYCNLVDNGGTPLDPSVWACKPALPNGDPCLSSTYCSDGVCVPNAGGNYVCTSPAAYFFSAVCDTYVRTP
jgi:hypothetical protein